MFYLVKKHFRLDIGGLPAENESWHWDPSVYQRRMYCAYEGKSNVAIDVGLTSLNSDPNQQQNSHAF